jgi:hypothetical protein
MILNFTSVAHTSLPYKFILIPPPPRNILNYATGTSTWYHRHMAIVVFGDFRFQSNASTKRGHGKSDPTTSNVIAWMHCIRYANYFFYAQHTPVDDLCLFILFYQSVKASNACIFSLRPIYVYRLSIYDAKKLDEILMVFSSYVRLAKCEWVVDALAGFPVNPWMTLCYYFDTITTVDRCLVPFLMRFLLFFSMFYKSSKLQ